MERRESMDPAVITLLFLAFAIIMFVMEKIPIALTSMIVCIGLILTNVLDPAEAFHGFVDTNVILFVAMFIVGGALFETGMANRIGGIVAKFAKSERQLIVAIMVVTGMMSGLLSNTGSAAVLIPVVVGIASKTGYSRARLLMPLALAAAMGGNLSLIGAPGNLMAQSALQDVGLSFGFFEFGYVGIPILVVGIIFFSLIGYRFLPEETTPEETTNDKNSTFSEEENIFSDIPKWKQTLSLIILIITILGMIFENQIGIPLYVTACVGAILLILFGVITDKQAYKSIDMQTIFLFGGTLALAEALEKTGAGSLIADTVIGLLGQNASPFALLVTIFLLAAVLTNFMSNTATTALLVPISLSIATGMGADPRAVLMATVIGGSCAYATPIGMPANTMVLSPGGYKFMDYVKAGLPLMVVSTIVSLVLLPLLFPFYP